MGMLLNTQFNLYITFKTRMLASSQYKCNIIVIDFYMFKTVRAVLKFVNILLHLEILIFSKKFQVTLTTFFTFRQCNYVFKILSSIVEVYVASKYKPLQMKFGK